MLTFSSSASNYELFADFNVDMEKDPNTYDILKDIDVEALKTSIRNILMTRKGTRRMQPEFGANLEDKLFEPLDTTTARSIGEIINEQIEMWDPDIRIHGINIVADEVRLRYNVTITFSTKTSSINTTTIKFILEQR